MGWLLLAAGQGRRFGGNKLLAQVNGEPILGICLDRLQSTPWPLLCVVNSTNEAVIELLQRRQVSYLVCQDADQGMGHSLAAGASAIASSWPWVGVVLADMPFIRRATLLALAERARPDGIVRPSVAQVPEQAARPGHPVMFGQRFFADLAKVSGDQGAQALVRAHADQVDYLTTDDRGTLVDIDTRADLAAASRGIA
jgi:molybdenum cofactor cytidylyltransferase